MTNRDDLDKAIEEAIFAHDLLMNAMEGELQGLEPDEDDDSEAAAQDQLTHDAMSARLRRADDHLSTAILWMKEIQGEMAGLWETGTSGET